jgi:hypothetical protein
MKKMKDSWAQVGSSFTERRSAVDRRIKEIYAITIDDAGIADDHLKSHWQTEQSPNEFVEWFGMKFDLEPLSTCDRIWRHSPKARC